MLCVDALQVYRQLEAGTAKPTLPERQQIPTHLLDLAEPDQTVNAALWAQHADLAIAEVHARGQWPLLVGGTGLYLRALQRGLAEIPPIPEALRANLADEYRDRGEDALWQELHAVDPAYAQKTPPQNRQRLLRALEVFRHTGRTFSDFHREHQQKPSRHQLFLVLLDPPRQLLHARIDARAAEMAAPLLAEVAELRAQGLTRDLPAFQALGYREAWHALENHESTEEFAHNLALAHRNYAKKQATWFRGETADLRLPTADPAAVAAALRAWFAAE